MEQSRRFIRILQMSDLSIDTAKRHVKEIPGLVAAAKTLLKSDLAENIYLSSVADKFIAKTTISNEGNIIIGQTPGGILQRIKYLGMMMTFPIVIILKLIHALVFHPRLLERQKYKAGVRIYQGDFGFDYGAGRDIDFIVGGTVANDDILFCSETEITKKYRDEFIRRGHKLLPLKYCFLFGDIINVLRVWPRFLCHSFCADTSDIRVSLDIMYKYILWTGFIRMVDIDTYLVYGDYVPTAMVRTILFNQSGIKVWYYCNSYAYWYVYAGGEDKVNQFLAFYLCDKALTWGDAQKRFIEKQSCGIKSVEHTGCLWAQKVHRKQHEGTIVSVFDTSYGSGYGVLTNEDMLKFLQDILRLADERKDIAFLYKPKTRAILTEERDPRIKEVYGKILHHPRIKVVGDPAEAIAMSDLVISVPYSSPSMEAWAAGMKGIFHDANGNIRSNLLEDIPNVVSHSYEELRDIVDFWLDDVNDIIFNVFLQQYILGEIDAYLDCKGIDHLREMLLDE
jgi:polysaccharide biosynthesis PFTS motif protein